MRCYTKYAPDMIACAIGVASVLVAIIVAPANTPLPMSLLLLATLAYSFAALMFHVRWHIRINRALKSAK